MAARTGERQACQHPASKHKHVVDPERIGALGYFAQQVVRYQRATAKKKTDTTAVAVLSFDENGDPIEGAASSALPTLTPNGFSGRGRGGPGGPGGSGMSPGGMRGPGGSSNWGQQPAGGDPRVSTKSRDKADRGDPAARPYAVT